MFPSDARAARIGMSSLTPTVTLLLMALGLGATPLPSLAQEDRAVRLEALDGSAVVKGDLVEVSDGSYVIETAIGTMRISIDEADCTGGACPLLDARSGDFSISGPAESMQSLVPALLSGYAETVGADYGVKEAVDGSLQVTLVDRKDGVQLAAVDLLANDGIGGLPDAPAVNVPVSGDLRLYTEAVPALPGEGDDDVLLAFDGVALIVHRDNPIKSLSRRAIADLFACAEVDWRSVGGPEGPVRLYALDDGSPLPESFSELALQPFGSELCDQVEWVESSYELAEAVANDPLAIGFFGLGDARNAKALPILECNVAHEPSAFNVKTEDYPLARRILLDAPSLEESSAVVQRFIDFTLSDGGQRQVQTAGLVGLSIDSTRPQALDYRLTRIEAAASVVQQSVNVTRLVEETKDAARLSATFRFRSGAGDLTEENALDNRAQRDLGRLARYLKENVGDSAELLLFGFADASGAYEANLALSQQRAQSVADKLEALGVPVAVVAGFGEEAPIACNDGPAGRAKNRRVEVWLRKFGSEANSRLVKAPM